MSFPQISDEVAAQAAALYKKHGGKIRPAAKEAGVRRATFRNRLKRAAERGMMPTEPVMPGFEIKQTTAEYDAGGNLTKEWIKQQQESGPAFQMPAGQVYKGVSVLTDAEGRARLTWHKTRTDTATPDLVAALEATFKAYKGKARPAPAPRRSLADYLTVYPIADQHNGLLAWGRETGEAYDLAIGIKRLRESMASLVAQSKPSRRALILNLGDWQHTDDQRNMTPRSGNLLDVDSRYFKILSAGVDLMIECIETAKRRHAQVIVRNIPGNHDPHAAIALTIALKMFYARDRRVTIDDDPGEFFFHRFGAVMIGAHHGHRAKADRLAATMAAVRPTDWGASAFRYFYTGHIHHETAKEIGGVKVESFQTLAAKDAHAVGSAYLSGQSLTAITLHRRAGETGRHRVNILPPAFRAA
jgi:transposase-like protein